MLSNIKILNLMCHLEEVYRINHFVEMIFYSIFVLLILFGIYFLLYDQNRAFNLLSIQK